MKQLNPRITDPFVCRLLRDWPVNSFRWQNGLSPRDATYSVAYLVQKNNNAEMGLVKFYHDTTDPFY